MVAKMMKSISRTSRPASAMAASAACSARSVEPMPGSTKRRSRMPVRSTIHSSLVSMSLARSWLVTTRSGTWNPTPLIRDRMRPSGAGILPRREQPDVCPDPGLALQVRGHRRGGEQGAERERGLAAAGAAQDQDEPPQAADERGEKHGEQGVLPAEQR